MTSVSLTLKPHTSSRHQYLQASSSQSYSFRGGSLFCSLISVNTSYIRRSLEASPNVPVCEFRGPRTQWNTWCCSFLHKSAQNSVDLFHTIERERGWYNMWESINWPAECMNEIYGNSHNQFWNSFFFFFKLMSSLNVANIIIFAFTRNSILGFIQVILSIICLMQIKNRLCKSNMLMSALQCKLNICILNTIRQCVTPYTH